MNLLQRRTHENSPGTPYENADTSTDNSEIDDPLINSDVEKVLVGNVIKAHKGFITTVNIFDVSVCPNNGLFRGTISDGENFSNKVLFNEKLNDRVREELIGEGKVTEIKLEIVEVLQGVIVGIVDYTKMREGPHHVGEAAYVGNDFYRQFKPRGCFTPSRMKKRQLFK